jgi:hypothetical protein
MFSTSPLLAPSLLRVRQRERDRQTAARSAPAEPAGQRRKENAMAETTELVREAADTTGTMQALRFHAA